MSTISLPGLYTGIDTNQIISQLMAINQRRLQMLEKNRDAWQQRKEALSTLESKLAAFRTTVQALDNAAELRAFAVTSSDTDKITAEATYNAFEGNYTVQVNQLASAERWVHGGLEYAEDYVGAGTFVYSYNHRETTITTTATTTLQDLVGLVNNDADNPGVTASLLYYNQTYHLVLNGNDAGSDYQISVNDSNTEVREAQTALTVDTNNAVLSTRIVDLDQFSGSLVSGETIIITSKQHDGTAVNHSFAVTSNTKLSHLIAEINEAFGGTATATLVNGKIVLADHTCGTSQMQISLSYDPGSGSSTLGLPTISRLTEGGSITATLTDFAPATFTESQSARDSQIRIDGYPAGQWISRSSNTVTDVIPGVTLHLHDTTDVNGVEVNLTRDVSSVGDKVKKMVDAYNAAVAYIQEKTGYNELLGKAGLLMGDYIVSTIRNQIRNPYIARASGFQQDVDTFLMPGDIGLELDRDGMLSLDSSRFDEAIGQDYLGVLALIGAAKTGSSDSNTIKFYGANAKYTTAGTYNVEVIISGGAITSARIKLTTESTWRDATRAGNIITGDSTFNSKGEPVYPENGLQLSVDLGSNGTHTAVVQVAQGFAGAVEQALGYILKTSTGSLKIDQEYTATAIGDLKTKIEREQERLERVEGRLVEKFARLEKALALLQRQLGVVGMLGK